MRALILVMVSMILAGCDRTETVETTGGYAMPEHLKNCRVYELRSQHEMNLYVVDCPDSVSTTWETRESCGKNCSHMVPHTSVTPRG